MPPAPAKDDGTKDYEAIATYVPVYNDEVKLSVGDRVTVLKKYDDGR